MTTAEYTKSTEQTETDPRIDALIQHWAAIYGEQQGYLGATSIDRRNVNADGKPTVDDRSFPYPLLARTAAEWLLGESDAGRDAYHGAHLTEKPGREKAHAAAMKACYADIDHNQIPASALQPSRIIESSPGRWQAYMRLAHLITWQRAERINKALARAWNADPSGADISQILRTPGTRNYKRLKDDPNAPTVRVIRDDGPVYNPTELERLLGLETLGDDWDGTYGGASEQDASGAYCGETWSTGLSDDDVIDKARKAKNGDKFKKLFDDGDIRDYTNAQGEPDRSAADAGLVGMIRFYTGPNPEQIDRIFRRSKLMRDKWDRPTGASTYGARTIGYSLGQAGSDRAAYWSPGGPQTGLESKLSPDDFHAYLPTHKYRRVASGDLWGAEGVNAAVPPVQIGTDKDGEPVYQAASKWLDEHRPIHQETWAPGQPAVINDWCLHNDGWHEQPGNRVLNTYRAAHPLPGDPTQAEPWLEHIRKVYPDDADHIVKWFAQRVQDPMTKINHALVLGGAPGIGKDTLIEPVRYAVGTGNFGDVSPSQAAGRFNGFAQSVILRVSEARDLGDKDRFSFYDHMKTYEASPPEALRVDEKYAAERYIPNVVGVIYTTNNRTNGLFLPADDRRHYVAWSECSAGDFSPDYWKRLYAWYASGGYGHVAAYLRTLDLSDFDPKAPPLKTAAFWDMVNASRAPEDAELADALDELGRPAAVTLAQIGDDQAYGGISGWLNDRKNSRLVPHRMEAVGYIKVSNPTAPKDGYWSISGKRQAVYARNDLSRREQINAASALANAGYQWKR